MSGGEAIAGLEAGLRSKSDDWPAWLVYGDHLTSLGDVRGELIRLEHESAVAGQRDNARSRRLHNEARALIKQHEATWRAGLEHGVVAGWLHGFVNAVELTWNVESVAALAAFAASPDGRFLTRLSFSARGVTAESLAVIEALARLELPLLRCFSLAYTRLAGPGVTAARQATWCARLVELDLRYCDLRDEGVGALRGAELGQLQTLRLQKNALTAAGVGALGAVALPALRVLDLRYNPLGEAGARALAELPFVPRLEQLLVRGRDVSTGLAGAPLASSLRRFWSAR